MNNDAKLNVSVQSNQGVVLLGNQVIELQDCSTERFSTNSPLGFILYVSDIAKKKVSVFYNTREAAAYDNADVYTKEAFAVCTFVEHPFIQMLRFTTQRSLNLDDLINFLETLKPVCLNDAVLLLDNLNDLSIKKVVSITRQKSATGNFNFSVNAKDAGKSDYEFPKEISFKVPLLSYLPKEVKGNEIELTFLFSCNYKIESETAEVALSFKLSNPMLEIQLEEATKAFLKDYLMDDKYSLYEGSVKIIKQTNEWKYKLNKVSL
jgi:hypothetical protein